jgi:hypothetical protein
LTAFWWCLRDAILSEIAGSCESETNELRDEGARMVFMGFIFVLVLKLPKITRRVIKCLGT